MKQVFLEIVHLDNLKLDFINLFALMKEKLVIYDHCLVKKNVQPI